MDEEDEDYQKWNTKNEYLSFLFPNVGFDISIPLNELDDVITTKDFIIFKNSHKCYCYDGEFKPTDFIEVKKQGGNITYQEVLTTLNNIQYKVECNHHFFEGIIQSNDEELYPLSVLYEIFFGS